MKKTFQIFAYRLPFRAPVPVAGSHLAFREGLLLRLVDQDGVEGWGEAAPLPGFSKETLVDDLRNLSTVARLWCSNFPDALLTMRAPSVRFGLEQACLHIQATRAGHALHQLVSPKGRDSVRVNALLFGDVHEQLAKAVRSRLSGYRTVKVKVGRRAPEADAQFVGHLSADLGTDVRIRLDANRGWSLEEAVRFGKQMQGLPVEYIEEPVSNPLALQAFYDQTGMPVALDESVADFKPSTWGRIKGLAAVVLKPTLMGGIKTSLELANAAVSVGAMPVVSSAYESGVGTLGLAALAAYVTRPDDAAGLDAHWRLAEDVLAHRLDVVNGTLYLAGLSRVEVRTDSLKEMLRG